LPRPTKRIKFIPKITAESFRNTAERAGFRCSNPECEALTVALDCCATEAQLMGEVISMTERRPCEVHRRRRREDEIDVEEDGLWLCRECVAQLARRRSLTPTDQLRPWWEHAGGRDLDGVYFEDSGHQPERGMIDTFKAREELALEQIPKYYFHLNTSGICEHFRKLHALHIAALEAEGWIAANNRLREMAEYSRSITAEQWWLARAIDGKRGARWPRDRSIFCRGSYLVTYLTGKAGEGPEGLSVISPYDREKALRAMGPYEYLVFTGLT